MYDVDFIPTTANSITIYDITMDLAAYLQAVPGGTPFTEAERTGTGVYTESTDRHIWAGWLVSAVPDFAPSMLVNNAGLVG